MSTDHQSGGDRPGSGGLHGQRQRDLSETERTGKRVRQARCDGLLAFCLGLAALAAPVGRSYCCVVGYANVTMLPGYNFVANPLDAGTNNLTNVITAVVPDGTQVYVWDITKQSFLAPATFDAFRGTWDTNFNLPPGRGFVVSTPQLWTNTFVGFVAGCGATNHNLVAGGNKFSLLGSQLPLAGSVMTNANFNFQGTDGDAIYLFKTNQAYSDAFSFFANYGWFDPKGTTNGPVLAVGQSFFIQHPGPDYDWTQFVSSGFAAATPNVASGPTTLAITSLRMSAQNASLQIEHHGAKYDIQFSTDGIVWTTLAANRAGPIWTGPRPSSGHGYFRVIVAAKSKGGL